MYDRFSAVYAETNRGEFEEPRGRHALKRKGMT